MSLQDALRDGIVNQVKLVNPGSSQGPFTRGFARPLEMPVSKPNRALVAYLKEDMAIGFSQGFAAQPTKLVMDVPEDKPLSQLDAPLPTFAEVANNAPFPAISVLGNQFFSVSNVWQNMEGDVLQGLEKNLFQHFRGNADGTEGVNFGHSKALSHGAHSASSNRDFDPSDSEDSTKHQASCVTNDSAALRNWYAQLQERVVIGLCHGVRPSAEALKNWINVHWGSKNIRPSHVQYLPNNTIC
ncbi:hypothetical protein L7F22_014785 [Adiantum nelumboides]|nr:hypothetical protein [Adiantum nelumboides]